MVLGVKNKDSDQGSLKYGLEQDLQDRTASRISFIFSVEIVGELHSDEGWQ